MTIPRLKVSPLPLPLGAVGTRILPQQHGTEWGLVFAATTIAVLPTITVFVIFQRHFIKGVTSGAIKG